MNSPAIDEKFSGSEERILPLKDEYWTASNTKLTKSDIIDNYKHLWEIEYAFRVAKSDLKIRPIYHRIPRRIEVHICISFVAYKLYKKFERQFKERKSKFSPEKTIEIAKTIYSIEIEIPLTKEHIQKTLLLDEEQKELAAIFDF